MRLIDGLKANIARFKAWRATRAGQAHAQRKEWDQARSEFLEALGRWEHLSDRSWTSFTITLLADTWICQHRYSECLQFLGAYGATHPDNPQVYFWRGVALWYMGSLHEALDECSKGLNIDPGDIGGLSTRGQILAELGGADKAFVDLDGALKLLAEVSVPDAAFATWKRASEAYITERQSVGIR